MHHHHQQQPQHEQSNVFCLYKLEQAQHTLLKYLLNVLAKDF